MADAEAPPVGAAAPQLRPLDPPHRRLSKHPRLAHYNRLIALVVLLNLLVLIDHLERGDWLIADGSALDGLSTLVVVNVAAAVLIRQQHVVNVLFWLVGNSPRSWPLRLRWAVSKIYHIGGIHVGAAVCGAAFLVMLAAVATEARLRDPAAVPLPTLVTTYLLVAVVTVIVVCALPRRRKRAHDAFELTHRWGGWAAVGLFWVLTAQVELDHRGDATALDALLTSWQVWVLAVVTTSIALPWARLRRVPVRVSSPSPHVAIVHFEHMTPPLGANIGISRDPLREWHSFATVRRPGESGFRLLVSRAGDWTGAFIDDPPTHVWVRGVPVASLARIEPVYDRIVYVVTGSGLGPSFGQLLGSPVPIRLVWSVRSPRTTYGDAIVDEVLAAQPDAVIWDTTQLGKPDLVALTAQTCQEFGAEAVFVVSNEPTTRRIVHGLERLGIPAFGPIFDS